MNPRIVCCSACDGEGRLYEVMMTYECHAAPHWDDADTGPCPYCDGTGGEIIETEPRSSLRTSRSSYHEQPHIHRHPHRRRSGVDHDIRGCGADDRRVYLWCGMTTLAHKQRVLDQAAAQMAGKALIAAQIRRELAEACAASIAMREAENANDLVELQAMAVRCQKHSQTAQVLCAQIANDIARHRNRNPRIVK